MFPGQKETHDLDLPPMTDSNLHTVQPTSSFFSQRIMFNGVCSVINKWTWHLVSGLSCTFSQNAPCFYFQEPIELHNFELSIFFLVKKLCLPVVSETISSWTTVDFNTPEVAQVAALKLTGRRSVIQQ